MVGVRVPLWGTIRHNFASFQACVGRGQSGGQDLEEIRRDRGSEAGGGIKIRKGHE